MRKGSKVIKIKYEEDSIFVGAAWGRKRTRWGRKGARRTLEAISDYLKKGAGVHSEEAYLDEVKCDLLRLIRKRLYQQALKDGKEIKEYECSFEGVVIWPGKNKFICFNFGDGAVLGKTDQGHIGSLLLSEKRIRKLPQLTMDGAVSAVGLKRGVWSAYHELYILERRQERWAMSVSEDKIEEGENPLLLSIKAC